MIRFLRLRAYASVLAAAERERSSGSIICNGFLLRRRLLISSEVRHFGMFYLKKGMKWYMME